MSRRSARRAVVSAAVLSAVVVTTAAPAQALSRPDFQLPFACGERWEGSSRPTHTPSSLAVDWNRDAHDEGHIVVATAPGVVTAVVNLGNTSYGRYVVVDHGGTWSTLHAHLLASFVVVGQHVDQGQPIALLGNTGGSSGPHLHYEQRLNKTDQHAVFNGASLRYDSWLRSRNCGDVPVVGDWNGDRFSDVGVFGRQPNAAVFRQRLPDGSKDVVTFGLPTDTPLVGDWNGDGQSDLGVWHSATHVFVLGAPNGSRQTFSFGASGDLPVAGDWDGDGRDEVGVFHPATATFALRDANGFTTTKVFGSTSSWPLAGDWDGDGRDEVGVYDTATGVFTKSLVDGTTKAVTFGGVGVLPVVGNWGADPVSDLGVWDPSTATFTKRLGPKKTETIKFGKIR